jgi:phosphatidate cytidylyltransferase
LIGGLIAAAAFAALATFWFFPELPYKFSIPLAMVMAVVGVLGDLAESAMKRGSKTKDAASILPGHGGLLDRLDSLLLNARSCITLRDSISSHQLPTSMRLL